MIYLGVDPGLTGALAWLCGGEITVADMPVVAGEVDVDAVARLLRNDPPGRAVVERVHSMPGQGVASSFKFGMSYGAILAVVVVAQIETHLVTPNVWKKHYRLTADKEQARAMAIRLWPGCGLFSRKKDQGRAEAALLAKYCMEVIT